MAIQGLQFDSLYVKPVDKFICIFTEVNRYHSRDTLMNEIQFPSSKSFNLVREIDLYTRNYSCGVLVVIVRVLLEHCHFNQIGRSETLGGTLEASFTSRLNV